MSATPGTTTAPLNRLRTLWRDGRPTFGAIATIPSVQAVQVLARSGLDWLLIDLERGPVDLGAAHAMIGATAGTPCVPMVRIAPTQPWLAKAPLDLGALGVCFPMVRGRAEAEAAVRSVRYPPAGERTWGPFYAPPRWGVPTPGYLDAVDEEALCVVTIEHVDAVARIGDIVGVPGIDLALIGPGDLAAGLGLRGRVDHPDVAAAVARAEEGILASGVVLGGVARTAEQADAMVGRGYRALVLGSDWSLLQRGIAASLEGIRR
jgi:4-hydroxy-2-oxoheptanedioate aldolase